MDARHGKLMAYPGKRLLDLAITMVLLVALSPVIEAVALLIALRMGRPVIFTQTRPGRYAKLFRIYKFRTMTSATDAQGQLLPDRDRLTSLGRLLRTSSLDELPSLINVLKGEMSLVGPRPLVPRYLPFYTERELLRFSARPGISGWAQIHGRNQLPWDERLADDVWYVEHCSFGLDLRILFATFLYVIRRTNVLVDTSAEGDLSKERMGQSRTR